MAVKTIDPDEVGTTKVVGQALERREDVPLIAGDAEYTDDLQHPRMVYMAVARSQQAHARIQNIDTSAAQEMDGVIDVFTAEDVEASGVPGTLDVTVLPFMDAPDFPILAKDKVFYQGEALAVVVAESRYQAADAADAVEVDYDRLDAVVDAVEAAEDDAPVLHEDIGSNVGIDWELGEAEPVEHSLAEADHVVELEFVNQRLIPTAMEPRAAIAQYKSSTGELSVEMTSQNPHEHRDHLASALGIPSGKIRVRSPDVGGGFGSKIRHYAEETLTAWCAMQVGRPVKWQATRSEGFLTTSHGRDNVTKAKLAVDDDGSIQGFHVDTHVGVGGYLAGVEGLVASNLYATMLSGQYDIPAVYAKVTGTYTNTTPCDAYRGAGRPEAAYAVERMMSAAAKDLGMDPAEFRRKNYLSPDDFPHEVATGHVYDSGDYGEAIDAALDLVDYDDFRERQAAAREEGRYLGLGISCYIEACGLGPGLIESGEVRVGPGGGVTVTCGTHSHGQGHKTSYAQIVADELGIDYNDIEVREGDTAETAEGHGTYGSRSAPVGGSAIAQSAQKVREKAQRIAASQLEAEAADIEFDEGTFFVSGAPDRSVTIQEVAEAAYAGEVPEDEEPGLEETTYYNPANFTFPFGTHIAVVEVDPETGDVDFERYVAVDDVGNQINPKIVEGQIHGGIAQGLGQAMVEGAVYDENGQLLTGSLQDYAIPKAMDVPDMEVEETVTPCPHNPLGVKGVGEAGTIASTPAIVNAVVDALQPFGIDDVEMPMTGETVWQAIQDAEGGS